MKKVVISLLLLCALLTACARTPAGTGSSAPSGAGAPAPSAPVSATASPVPAEEAAPRAEDLLEDMTLEEKICQMLVIRVDDVTGRENETSYGEDFKAGLKEYAVGGLVFFTENIVSAEQVRGMIETAQSYAEIPLFISADEEGGRVRRLSRRLDTTAFGPMFDYRAEGEGGAYRNAFQIAGDMSAYDFNLDFAPVADVWTNPENTVIGDRAYSDDAQEAAVLVAAAVRGFLDGGVIPTLKHFPGHGDTEQDTHDGPVSSDATLEELRGRELLPFAAGIEAGAPVVMLSHIVMTAIDGDNPATFSKAIATDLLRGELGFDGVITTDALDMGALQGIPFPEIAVRAVSAGCDLLLGIKELPKVVEALKETIPESRIDESVLRILRLKIESGMM